MSAFDKVQFFGLNPLPTAKSVQILFFLLFFPVHAYKKELAGVCRDEKKVNGVKGIRFNMFFNFRSNAAPSSCFLL